MIIKDQNPGTLIWVTGLAGAGKTTIARNVYLALKEKHKNLVFLDGDSFREITQNTTSYSIEDRKKVAGQISRMCHFLTLQGIHVVCATISLFNEIQEMNRKNNSKYVEVYVKCDFDELVKRDQKGLYSAALAGKTKGVMGVDQPFEAPLNPEVIVDNSEAGVVDKNVAKVLSYLKETKGL